jgi:hypothetical protein
MTIPSTSGIWTISQTMMATMTNDSHSPFGAS